MPTTTASMSASAIAGLGTRGERLGHEEFAVLAGVAGDPDGSGGRRAGPVGSDLDDARRHSGRGGVQGEHEHTPSLMRLWTTPAARPGSARSRRTDRRRWPHDTPHSPLRGPGPDPRRLRAPARGGGALAGRPGAPHRSRPLRADLRRVRRRVRPRGLPHPLDANRTSTTCCAATCRTGARCTAASGPSTSPRPCGSGSTSSPRQTGSTARAIRWRSCASRCCATAGWTGTAGCGEKTRRRRSSASATCPTGRPSSC